MVPSTQPLVHEPEPARDRMRVLFVLGSFAGGGAERSVAHLIKHIDRGEFDARVGLLWRNGPYLHEVSDARLVVPRFMHGWIPYRDRPPWWRLLPSLIVVPLQQYEVVRRFRPDVVVTVTKSMNLAARVSLAAFGRRRTAWIAREGNNTGAMIDSEAGTGFLRRAHDAAVRGCYRSADAVVAISHGVASGLTTRFGLEPSHVRTVFNAVDLETVRARADEPPAAAVDGPFIVAAGRLDYQKGFDLLIRAYADRLKGRGLSLLILGDGPERPALEQLARELGVGSTVHLPGFVANPWAYFARATLFVCPSRWEGFGNVIIEAMACGAPVVVSDCDFGPREIVRHGESGMLVPSADVPALATAMASVVDDGALAARLSAAGRVRAGDFDVAPMARAYEAIFREVAPRRRRG